MTIQYEMKEPSAVRRELRIEVDAAEVRGERDRIAALLQRSAVLPGFRPGKVPRALLEKRFARDIEDQLMERLVPQALGEALARTGVWPVHDPVIKDVAVAAGEPLRFTASFEVRPRVEARDYRGVVVELPVRRVADADVDRELEALRQRHAHYEAVEPRPLAPGDHALVDLVSRDAAGEGEERRQDNAMVEVGGAEYHPEFAAALTGLGPGERKSFTIRYGDDDPDPRARGQSVAYLIDVKEVKRKVLPVLDDEFAQDVGEFQTLAELKTAVRSDLERHLEQQERREQERQLMQALAVPLAIEVPQSMVERELDDMVEEQARVLLMRGIDPRTAPIDWRATRDGQREAAVNKVKWQLLLEAVADQEGISVGADEVEERLQRIAEGSKRSVEYVRSKIEKDGRMDELKTSVRLGKTVDFLMRNARMERRS
jgi:trigger factor